MKLRIDNSVNEQARHIASIVKAYLQQSQEPLLCPASGDSTKQIYQYLCEDHAAGYDFTKWNFVGLDEWMGQNETDEGSCRYHLNHQLFHPLGTQSSKICFFDGKAEDVEEECRRIENFIENKKGIDVAILGLGLNGHIGMNEPGTPENTGAHIADIHPLTANTAQKYFTEQRSIKQGLTLGWQNILNAKRVILVVNGRHKAEIVNQLVHTTEPDINLPASVLRKHPNVYLWLDAEAASLL